MPNEYLDSLPKKRMAVGTIILNEKDEILIVKPSYKDHWSVAGGVIDKNESPRAALLREAKEEIGIDLKETKFLGVDYTSDSDEKTESLQFIFFGGKLSESEIEKIKIDGKEIVEYKFMNIDEALLLLNENLRKRLAKCLVALENDAVFYLENGK